MEWEGDGDWEKGAEDRLGLAGGGGGVRERMADRATPGAFGPELVPTSG